LSGDGDKFGVDTPTQKQRRLSIHSTRRDFEQMQHRISRILQILQVCDLPERFDKKLVTGAGRPPVSTDALFTR